MGGIKTSTEEILAQDRNGFIDYKPAKNSNEKKSVKLISTKDDIEKIFETLSAAAKFLETGSGNVIRAIDRKGTVKGYKVEQIKNQ